LVIIPFNYISMWNRLISHSENKQELKKGLYICLKAGTIHQASAGAARTVGTVSRLLTPFDVILAPGIPHV